ncbi:MAG: type VII toxin-antitoxin system MntA family adenylyltransferase antitoxin [Desulfotomaculales bacterium]
MDAEKLVGTIEEHLLARPDVAAAYVFGSAAQSRLRPASDVDIAVLFSSGTATGTDRFERRLELAMALEELVKRPVEVVDLETAPPFLQHQVRKSGKLIVDRDPRRRKALEVASRRLYLDMLPYLRYRRTRDDCRALYGRPGYGIMAAKLASGRWWGMTLPQAVPEEERAPVARGGLRPAKKTSIKLTLPRETI